MPLKLKEILTYVGIAGAAGIGAYALFKIAQDYFGVFAYPSLNPSQVNDVANEYYKRFKVVTSACDNTHCRGVLDTGGALYYYRWEFDKSYEIYPMLIEKYLTTKPIFGDSPQLVYPNGS